MEILWTLAGYFKRTWTSIWNPLQGSSRQSMAAKWTVEAKRCLEFVGTRISAPRWLALQGDNGMVEQFLSLSLGIWPVNWQVHGSKDISFSQALMSLLSSRYLSSSLYLGWGQLREMDAHSKRSMKRNSSLFPRRRHWALVICRRAILKVKECMASEAGSIIDECIAANLHDRNQYSDTWSPSWLSRFFTEVLSSSS